jgi:hypothetical protein
MTRLSMLPVLSWDHSMYHHDWLILLTQGSSFLSRLASIWDVPHLCLFSSRDYRSEPLCSALMGSYLSFLGSKTWRKKTTEGTVEDFYLSFTKRDCTKIHLLVS